MSSEPSEAVVVGEESDRVEAEVWGRSSMVAALPLGTSAGAGAVDSTEIGMTIMVMVVMWPLLGRRKQLAGSAVAGERQKAGRLGQPSAFTIYV